MHTKTKEAKSIMTRSVTEAANRVRKCLEGGRFWDVIETPGNEIEVYWCGDLRFVISRDYNEGWIISSEHELNLETVARVWEAVKGY